MTELAPLFSDLIRVQIDLWNTVDARLRAQCQLPLSHYEPMIVIDGTPSCRVFDIAGQLSITVGGTSKLVDRLEGGGLCRRRANQQDRRSSTITLTPAGRRLLTRARAVVDDELAVRLGGALSDRALGQLAQSLASLRVHLTKRSTAEATR